MKNAADVQIDETAPRNYNYIIELRNRYYSPSKNELEVRAIRSFMSILRSYIAIKTDLCYNIPPITKVCSIIIPIDVLSSNDVVSYRSIMVKKVAKLKSFLEHEIDYNGFLSSHKMNLSALEMYHFDFEHMLYITSPQIKNTIDIKLKPCSLIKTTIKTHQYGKDCYTEVINPYLTESLIAVDVSVPYSEMGLGYNLLHIYEHLLCSPWVAMKSTTSDEIVTMNGLTTNLGNCYVYVSPKNKETYRKCLANELEWLYGLRDENSFGKHGAHVEKEIQRTISETKSERNYTQFARSPGNAYDLSVKNELNVFQYWANQPLRILLIHPFTTCKLESFNVSSLSAAHPMREINLPPLPTFHYFPYCAIANNRRLDKTTMKLSPKEMANVFRNFYLKGEVDDGQFGIDVKARDIDEVVNDFFHDSNVFLFFPIQSMLEFRGQIPDKEIQQIIIRHLCNEYSIVDIVEPHTAFTHKDFRARALITMGVIPDDKDDE